MASDCPRATRLVGVEVGVHAQIEVGVFREQALSGPVRGCALAVAGFVEQRIYDIRVPALDCFDCEDGWAGEVAEEGEVIVRAKNKVVDDVEAA